MARFPTSSQRPRYTAAVGATGNLSIRTCGIALALLAISACAHKQTIRLDCVPKDVTIYLDKVPLDRVPDSIDLRTDQPHVLFFKGEGYEPVMVVLEIEESGGWQARRRSYVERAARIHRTLMLHSVGMLLREEECSSVLRTYLLPDRVGYASVHDALKAAGFVIYAGQGDLAPDVFRIAYMGDITAADLDALCGALGDAFLRAT